MNKQPAVTEQTKANLKRAFWGLYTEKPLTKITVREITDAAGYNRGTFYLYFRDVYDILEQMEDELLGVIDALVQERLIKDGQLNIEENMGFILELARKYSGYFSVLLGDEGDPRFKSRFKELVLPLIESCAMPARGGSPEELRLLREFYLSGLLAVVTAWLEDEDAMPIDRFIRLILGAVFGAGTDGEGRGAAPDGTAPSR